MNISTFSTIIGVVTALGGGGYAASQLLELKADKAELHVVGVRVDFIIDKQIESTLAQINRLEAKQGKTPDDFEQLRYLREELQRLRSIRRGS